MKLTKGKINKLYNKKKQTLKRFKNKNNKGKNKTFRKRKHLNLHNSTLKKYGGGNEDEKTSETIISEPDHKFSPSELVILNENQDPATSFIEMMEQMPEPVNIPNPLENFIENQNSQQGEGEKVPMNSEENKDLNT
jgi:hypothetical protein